LFPSKYISWSGAKKPASEFAHLRQVKDIGEAAAEEGDADTKAETHADSNADSKEGSEEHADGAGATDVHEDSEQKAADEPGTPKLLDLRWKKSALTIDVMIPCYAEDLDVLRETIEHCNAMWVPEEVRRVIVWLLDDGGKAEREQLCQELGVRYHLRADKGKHAKAGNLNAALKISEGDMILILDADMAPEPHCLLTLLEPMLKVLIYYGLVCQRPILTMRLHAVGILHCIHPSAPSLPRFAQM
jgi:hypothetical protein